MVAADFFRSTMVSSVMFFGASWKLSCEGFAAWNYDAVLA